MPSLSLVDQLLAHLNPPLGPIFLHCPHDGKRTNPANYAQDGEEPSVADGLDKGLGNDTSDTAEYIPHKVVDCHTAAAALRKKLRKPVNKLATTSQGNPDRW
jgi:hypothetical protein